MFRGSESESVSFTPVCHWMFDKARNAVLSSKSKKARNAAGSYVNILKHLFLVTECLAAEIEDLEISQLLSLEQCSKGVNENSCRWAEKKAGWTHVWWTSYI